jgi:hypothetical protein
MRKIPPFLVGMRYEPQIWMSDCHGRDAVGGSVEPDDIQTSVCGRSVQLYCFFRGDKINIIPDVTDGAHIRAGKNARKKYEFSEE